MKNSLILTYEQLDKRIRGIIDKHTYLKMDKDRMYFGEIYIDYNEKLENSSIKEIGQSSDPMATFYDCFNTFDSEYYEQKQLLNTIKEQLNKEKMYSFQSNEENIEGWVEENVYFNFSYEHFLKQKVNVNIMIDTGDGNYDYTLNNFASYNSIPNETISNESGILWLVKQQGYNKRDLNKVIRKQEFKNSKFLESVYTECVNVTSHMNALAFFVKMTLGEYLDYLQEPTDILVSEKTNCGLYDNWNGAGGCLEIELEKAVTIPYKYATIHVDGCQNYGIDDIYGMSDSFWKDTIIKHEEMKKTA